MDDIRKALDNIIHDLQARHLLVPAGAIVVLIALAIVALPKHGGAAVPPVTSAAPAVHDGNSRVRTADVANISMITVNSQLDGNMIDLEAKDPFGTGNGATAGATGASGGTTVTCQTSGSTGDTGQSTTTCTTGGSPGDTNTKPKKKEKPPSSYLATFTLDGTTYSKQESGDGAPVGTPLVYYAGTDDSGKKGQFLVADGVTVQGASFDASLGVFTLAPDDNAILTDDQGATHTFTLEKLIPQS